VAHDFIKTRKKSGYVRDYDDFFWIGQIVIRNFYYLVKPRLREDEIQELIYHRKNTLLILTIRNFVFLTQDLKFFADL
jgi:hypothetical protein